MARDPKKRTIPGTPKTYVVELGPITCHAFGAADVRRMESWLRKELDLAVRQVFAVGPYSKTVKTRVEEASANCSSATTSENR